MGTGVTACNYHIDAKHGSAVARHPVNRLTERPRAHGNCVLESVSKLTKKPPTSRYACAQRGKQSTSICVCLPVAYERSI